MKIVAEWSEKPMRTSGHFLRTERRANSADCITKWSISGNSGCWPQLTLIGKSQHRSKVRFVSSTIASFFTNEAHKKTQQHQGHNPSMRLVFGFIYIDNNNRSKRRRVKATLRSV